jgi:outer membrane protein OmpA-like peptidoglycan-associated protein
MFSTRFPQSSRAKDEAEKPFWISYADLMTALMVLFLVVMSVGLVTVTKTVTERERAEAQYGKDVEAVLDGFEEVTRLPGFEGITMDRERKVIDFGTRARFPFDKSTLTAEQEKLLRAFVPTILEKANDERGRRVLKRVAVDGFTDKKGTYLSNLDLSLQRSQRVLCALFATPSRDERPLTPDQLEQIRALFIVGGYSFNAAKNTDDESRRVEMRLELLAFNEKRPTTDGISPGNFGICRLAN